MTTLSSNPRFQALDARGVPLVGGKLYTFAAGTTTPLTTYQDADGETANENPIELDARGEATVRMTVGLSYKFVLHDADDVPLWTVDNIQPPLDFSASTGSANVGFLQAGTGAVARTAQAKMREVISVTDFSTPQEALTAGAGRGVLFPEGSYTGGLTVPSNTTVLAYGNVVITQSTEGAAAGFIIAPGSTDITIDGFDIRGPWYVSGVPDWPGGTSSSATWDADYAENIGIDIRGRWYQREVLGYDAAAMGALTDECERITVRNCKIRGFGQSGILADQVSVFKAHDNTIEQCGRDGIRMYGVVGADVSGNTIDDLSPGYGGASPNFNVYGITATRLYGSAGVPDSGLTIGRPSQDVVMQANRVTNCTTWKSLDTHGGRGIRFLGNTVRGSHIGIGVDKGGLDAEDGIAPALDITISGNTIAWDSATYRRAGITIYGDSQDDAELATKVVISGNTIDGYGGDTTDGAISLSNACDVSITGNTLRDSLRNGVNIAQRCEQFSIIGNTFDNVTESSLGVSTCIAVQTGAATGVIDCNTFRNRTETATVAVTLQEPDSGYGVIVGNRNTLAGTVELFSSQLMTGYESSGAHILTPVAMANVTGSTGEVTLSRGLDASTPVTHDSAGVYTIKLADAAPTTGSIFCALSMRTGSRIGSWSVTAEDTIVVSTTTLVPEASDASFSIVIYVYQ